jgi:hypothetical protein
VSNDLLLGWIPVIPWTKEDSAAEGLAMDDWMQDAEVVNASEAFDEARDL